jgi:hypothetical protein
MGVWFQRFGVWLKIVIRAAFNARARPPDAEHVCRPLNGEKLSTLKVRPRLPQAAPARNLSRLAVSPGPVFRHFATGPQIG